MDIENNKGILLESGTNELEIIEFGIAGEVFGINVIKVREVINPLPVTRTPKSHPHVMGIIQLRGEVLPVIDLAKALGFPPSEHPEQDKFIIAELNQMKVAFHVHSVSRIHRISWEQIEKPSELTRGLESSTTGVVKMEDRFILLLDFEKIVVDISPEAGFQSGQMRELGERPISAKRILLAEDSAILRKLIEETLHKAGYTHVEACEDGNEAWRYLEHLVGTGQDVTEHIQLVITDIEMPGMDGHHLTKRIKEHPELQKLPVVIFSSLITDDLRHKGEKVGADAQVSKPEIVNLVKVIDGLIL
ncbi:chemotaxis protein [Aneurinibacillus thermoaerophilus]|uniref:Chemotaxis protein n=1 Tax=Aneurinibacillus thermoaerophilus TaxID=143495 RepID=A0ABX8Y785_ANETH|nr:MULTISPECIES: chemotaxis protein [Aneurinibacillus]AMA73000.1 chemotaxis protein CheV [Aneurinibacillus sp. XH2]MED0675949.1 chemotaxis protein [Aneurinibacillus thermoaerophilus]MED0677776.1 chemotaxis protein [Aneurinibacillus thermoaerophilus]MED0737525.1 chemotaxis protein [Aneurinibacillus thermoaerophilus]MED0758096.1 chemotaxis protein [Aneurinibacillus thermoaerophilus]